MNFTVEGADSVRLPGEASPLVKLAHKALDALPDGKLWTVERLAVAIQRSHSHTKLLTATGDFASHRIKAGIRFLYGSKRTVNLWRKEQAKSASEKS